jgi:hypothetical protein
MRDFATIPGRPPHKTPSKKITIICSRKLNEVSGGLVVEEDQVIAIAEVARSLVWWVMGKLISQGVIDRRKGASQSEDFDELVAFGANQ